MSSFSAQADTILLEERSRERFKGDSSFIIFARLHINFKQINFTPNFGNVFVKKLTDE